jgi:uncharacterized protein YbjT (DUF2867 family)
VTNPSTSNAAPPSPSTAAAPGALRCLIAGGSGVVGGRLVQRLLAHPGVARVTAVGRRPLGVRHDKLVAKQVDMTDAGSIGLACPDEVDVAFCCLGTTLRQAGSKQAFRAVDFDAVVAFAEAARTHGARRFVLISSLGASSSSSSFYLRVKGEAEDAVARVGFPSFVAVRPSLLDDEGARRDRRVGEQAGLAFMRVAGAVIGRQSRWAAIPADTVAAAMVRLALEPATTSTRVVQSEELHTLAA